MDKKRDVTILTSAFEPSEYIDQYIKGIQTWLNNPYVEKVHLLFCSVVPDNLSERNDEITLVETKLAEATDDSELSVEFIRGEGENYPETINKLLRHHVRTEFVGILNLDDWRDINAIKNQVAVLDSGADLTYGDFVVVGDLAIVTENANGQTTYQDTYEFDLTNRQKNYYQRVFKWGPFLMWRRMLHNRIGYYDETLKVAADFDWINRVIEYDYILRRTEGVMGAFLSIGKGLSTVPNTEGHKENAYVQQRYFHNMHENIINHGGEKKWREFKKRNI